MAVKPFDIIINSKYRAEGTNEAASQMDKLAKTVGKVLNIQAARMFVNQILDLSRAADPERWERIDKVFSGLQEAGGRLVNQVLGPMLDLVERIGKQATTALSPKAQSQEFFDFWIKKNKEASVSSEEMARRLKAQSDAAVELGQKAKDAGQLPFWINVKEFGIDAGQMRQALADQSKTFAEYIQALRTAGIAVGDLNDELKKFAALKGITLPDPSADIKKAGDDYVTGMKAIEQQTTEARSQAATERMQLLENLALAESRRLQDVARANAQQLKAIEQQRVAALTAATETYQASLAQIDADSAEQRIRIEQDYQERIRQINESSATSIEDAIERRDARALSKALQSRAQQLGQAARDHNRQEQETAQNAEKQRQQAAAQYAAAQHAAEEAARQAIAAQRAANQQATEEARIAQRRTQEDFDISKTREQQALEAKLRQQTNTLEVNYGNQLMLYKKHLNEITAITDEAIRPTSTLANAIVKFVQDAIGDILGELGISPTSGGTGGGT
jgi:hypothetical protein